MPEILYLLDGHALAYRSYYALTAGGSDSSRWATTSGEPTAGVYGFTAVLLRILEQENPDYIAVAFDTGKTFRHSHYKEYKATRAKMPDDLRPQVERMRQMVDAFNIPRLEVENYEADDVLGSLAIWAAKEKGLGVKIITGDRDLLQLVSPRIVVSLPSGKLSDSEDYFPADVQRKLGVLPEQVVDYKALVGDTSDNIPGVRGIGQKTAVTLLEKYITLDNIYENLEQITGRAHKSLVEGKDSAYLSQYLARIITDLRLDFNLEDARANRFDPNKVEVLFRELEFRTLVQRLHNVVKKIQPVFSSQQQLALFSQEEQTIPNGPELSHIKTHIIDTAEKLESLTKKLSSAKNIAFDTETTGTDAMQADLVGISLAITENEGFYIPVGHAKGRQLPIEIVIKALKPALNDKNISKVAHNAKFDMLILKRYGLDVEPITFDTMIAEWVINPDSRNLGLKNLAWIRLNYEMTHIESLIGKGKSQISMREVEVSKAAAYAVADAVISLQLMSKLESDLIKTNSKEIFNKIEIPLISVLTDMEFSGIKLDKDFFINFSKELDTRLFSLEDKIYKLVGEPFNLNSTQQLSEVLFKRLELEPPDRARKTSSGFLSTAANILEDMRGQHEVVDLILEYRELSKLKSTYVDSLPNQINPKTGRVHSSFNQTGTVTGRIASSDPNLQNIPTRTDLGRKVRLGFIAEPDHVLLAIDYSQIELRIVAHMANDKAMLEAFQKGQDIHATTAAAIFNIPLEQVTKNQRRHAKAINFGLIYGMSAFGLTRSTELTLAESEDFVKAYFERFPGIKEWLINTRKLASSQGYVETLLGRRRYFPNLKSGTNYNLRQREEREAINAPIQGTAADIIKLAMLHLPPELRKANLRAKLLLQVHDELILEVPQSEIAQTVTLVQKVMANAYQLKVPLLTEARVGTSWGELEIVD